MTEGPGLGGEVGLDLRCLTLCSFASQGHIRDITDSLIEHCQDKKLDENANVQLSDDKVIAVVLDLFGAGTCSSVNHSVLRCPKLPHP